MTHPRPPLPRSEVLTGTDRVHLHTEDFFRPLTSWFCSPPPPCNTSGGTETWSGALGQESPCLPRWPVLKETLSLSAALVSRVWPSWRQADLGSVVRIRFPSSLTSEGGRCL